MTTENFEDLTPEEQIKEVLQLDTGSVKTISGYGYISDFRVTIEERGQYLKSIIYPEFEVINHDSTSGNWYKLPEIIQIGDKKVEEFYI